MERQMYCSKKRLQMQPYGQKKHVIARRPKADVAIPKSVRKPVGIATPVFRLARNDVLFLDCGRNQSFTYWIAMHLGPPWVMKAGDRGTISNWAPGMAAFSISRAMSALSGAAAWEM